MTLDWRVGAAENDIYEAFKHGTILLTKCSECGFCRFYPYSFCHNCGSSDLFQLNSSGKGIIHTLTINKRRDSEDVIVVVELEDGALLLSRLKGATDDYPLDSIGRRVELSRNDDQSFSYPEFVFSHQTADEV